jgi:hypothetical protein
MEDDETKNQYVREEKTGIFYLVLLAENFVEIYKIFCQCSWLKDM